MCLFVDLLLNILNIFPLDLFTKSMMLSFLISYSFIIKLYTYFFNLPASFFMYQLGSSNDY